MATSHSIAQSKDQMQVPVEMRALLPPWRTEKTCFKCNKQGHFQHECKSKPMKTALCLVFKIVRKTRLKIKIQNQIRKEEKENPNY